MELLLKIAQFILMISILVILHEFGHYIPAKLFKIKIEKFFLFFDVKFALLKKKIGETTWGIGWLPLGGYVKIAGMVDESMDREQMAKPPQPWELIFSMILFNYGDRYIPSKNLKNGLEIDSIGKVIGFKTGDKILSVDGKSIEKITLTFDSDVKNLLIKKQPELFIPIVEAKIDKVSDKYEAHRIGLQKGDIITKIDDAKVTSWNNFKEHITGKKNQSIKVEILRGDQLITKIANLDETGILGVTVNVDSILVEEEFSFLSSLKQGYHNSINSLVNQVRQLKLMINKEAIKEVRGLVGIVEVMPSGWNLPYFLYILASFSIWLGFINILPIPALDGGHVMFLLYEMISRKKPSQRVLETGQIIGFVLVMGLTLFTLGNDLFRIFFR